MLSKGDMLYPSKLWCFLIFVYKDSKCVSFVILRRFSSRDENFPLPTKTCTTFENFLIKISLNKESFHFRNLHRPLSSILQFQSLLVIHHITGNLVIISDFNFHLDTTCLNSKSFHSLIDSFDLIQKVNFSDPYSWTYS